jgi:hypothetical protein
MESTDHMNTPWLFSNTNDYKRSIAALELLGTALLLKILVKHHDHQDITVQAPIKTDNEGNAYALLQCSSTAWPQCAILAEIAATSHKHGVILRPSHDYREHNTWADDLTNGLTEGWNKDKRIRFQLANTDNWLVLTDILHAAGYQTYTAPDTGGGHASAQK